MKKKFYKISLFVISLNTYKVSNAAQTIADKTPPLIEKVETISQDKKTKLNNLKLNGSVNILITASDKSGISNIKTDIRAKDYNTKFKGGDFSQLPTDFFKVATSSPAYVSFDTNYFSNGTYEILVEVTDKFQNKTQKTLPVKIENAKVDVPIVSIPWPAEGSKVSGTIKINPIITSKNPIQTTSILINKWDLRYDWNKIQESKTTPFNFSIDTTQYETGCFRSKIKVVATDKYGNIGESKLIGVDFSNPRVDILFPKDKSEISGTINIKLLPNSCSFAGFKFLFDENHLELGPSDRQLFTLNTLNYTDGSHTLTALGLDISGNPIATSKINVNIVNKDTNRGIKLVGSGAIDATGLVISQGNAVAISADGNTAVVGAQNDNDNKRLTQNSGAVWIFKRSNDKWIEQAKLVTKDIAGQGSSVAISADGNTVIAGAAYFGNPNYPGSCLVYTRSNETWKLQAKLVGNDSVGKAMQGESVAISEDGNTVIVGGSWDNNQVGAVWFYKRFGDTWKQQGPKIEGYQFNGSTYNFGKYVALSADGNTAMVGDGSTGGLWGTPVKGGVSIFKQINNTWTSGGKIIPSKNFSWTGYPVALSGDGKTAIVGVPSDNFYQGTAWVYKQNGDLWEQQKKLIGSSAVGAARQGNAVSISKDGNVVILGGFFDNNGIGAAWVFKRNGAAWTQQSKIVDTSGSIGQSEQGSSVSISSDGKTAIIGAPNDGNITTFDPATGAAWIYAIP